METARRLDYKPNQVARSLAGGRTNLMALMVPDISNPFFAQLAKILGDITQSCGYDLLIMNSNDSIASQRRIIERLISRRVEGLMLIPAKPASYECTSIRDIPPNTGFPVVVIDRPLDEPVYDTVQFDNALGAYEATRYLIEYGHQRIGCIVERGSPNNRNPRLEGYRRAMTESQLTVDDNWIVYGDYRYESGYDAAARLLAQRVTGVFAANDVMALGFMKHATEQGYDIPRDVSLVGYDDSFLHYAQGSHLTSVRQDLDRLGMESWRLMQERVNLPGGMNPQSVMLRPKLMIRDSVTTPKGAE